MKHIVMKVPVMTRFAPLFLSLGCATGAQKGASSTPESPDTGLATAPASDQAADTGDDSDASADDAYGCDIETPLPRRLRRLSHREYAHTMADLFAVELDPRTDLAADTTVNGFDNDAETLRVSSLLADQYRTLAETVSMDADLSPWLTCDLQTDGFDCAESVLPSIARSVWRRPFHAAEEGAWLDLMHTLAADDGAEAGLRWTLAALLQSPHFLYRSELGTPDEHGTYTLDGWERATALSYHFWGTTPDEALLDAAEAGGLDDAAGMSAEMARLIEDPRFADQVAELADTWLHLHHLETVSRVDLTEADRTQMLDDVHTLIREAVRADATIDDLFKDGGILLEPALLTAHGVPEGSGPVQRGVMVRELLLCQPLPPPPSGVDTSAPDFDPDLSTRERFSQHSDDPLCASCHTLIDPLGFAFEHYDHLGRWRDTDHGHPIDASGNLDGVPFDGATELAAVLADDPRVTTCFVKTARRWGSGATSCADSVENVGVTQPLVDWATRPAFVLRAEE